MFKEHRSIRQTEESLISGHIEEENQEKKSSNEMENYTNILEAGSDQNDENNNKEEGQEMRNGAEDLGLLVVGDWVAVIYEREWHIGKILEVDEDEKDCLVSKVK